MNQELLTVFEYLERERGIDRESLAQAVESALMNASKRGLGPAREYRISIDRKTCDIRAWARVQVVGHIVNPHDQITLAMARAAHPEANIGDFVEIEAPPQGLGRIAAQVAKQAIMQRLRQAERERVHGEYRDRVGDIVSGAVKRFDRSDVALDLGGAEAVMPACERVPTEEYQIGDRLRALILHVASDMRGPDIVLTRSHPNFVRRLFELEVTEIADGTLEIKGIAREAGYRTKIAVHSKDSKVDPIGACVGMRGLRVKNIVRELSNEKIDVVRWKDRIQDYVAEALAPAKLARVDVEEETTTLHVLVNPDQLSLAIGKKGQNARLAAKLTGWRIDIERNEAEVPFEERVAAAIDKLANLDGVSRELAERLVHAGFLTFEGILAAEISDLEQVEGLDQALAQRVHDAASSAMEREHGPFSP